MTAALKLPGMLEFARMLLMPADALAGELFHGDGAAWLFGSSLHGDAPLSAAGSAIAGVWLNLLGHAVGWPSPEGGAGAITGALASRLRELGGETRTGAPVARVLTNRRGVSGVELAGGERIAARTVVATTTPHGLVESPATRSATPTCAGPCAFATGPTRSSSTGRSTRRSRGRTRTRGGRGRCTSAGRRRSCARALHEVAGGALPEQPFLLSGQQTIADPTRAPAGQHTVWAYTHTPPGVEWTADRRERFADAMENQIERFAPGFRERVLARHVMAPGDLHARNASLPGGDVGHGSYAMDQLIFRPVASLKPYATPCAGCSSGARRRFRAARCTASTATRRRGRRCARRGCRGCRSCRDAAPDRRLGTVGQQE